MIFQIHFFTRTKSKPFHLGHGKRGKKKTYYFIKSQRLRLAPRNTVWTRLTKSFPLLTIPFVAETHPLRIRKLFNFDHNADCEGKLQVLLGLKGKFIDEVIFTLSLQE